MKNIALVSLAALAILLMSSSQDLVRSRLEARLGWDQHAGFNFDFVATLEVSSGSPSWTQFR